MRDEGYCPVRYDKTMGFEWFDLRGFYHDLETASLICTTSEQRYPEFAAKHPYRRMAHVIIQDDASYYQAQDAPLSESEESNAVQCSS